MIDAAAMTRLVAAARDPRAYIARWRSEHPGAAVLGVLPMNFPANSGTRRAHCR